MKHKIASLVAVATAAVSIAAVAHAADNGDAAEATQKVTSPPVSEVSNWKDAGLRPANTSNVQALTRSLASIAESPEAVGPEEGTLDPSALRIAVASEAGQVALATSASGVCYTAQEALAGEPSVVCSAEMHPTGIIWGIGRRDGQAHLSGVAVDAVSGVDVVRRDGSVSPAKLENNGFVWTGKDDVASLLIHQGSVTESVDLSVD